MSEKLAQSDLVFESLRNNPEWQDREIPTLRFALVTASEWKRSQDGEVMHEDRPHIIGTDQKARNVLSGMAFLGLGVPPGWLKYRGEWITGLRFINLPFSSAAHMIADLSGELARMERETD